MFCKSCKYICYNFAWELFFDNKIGDIGAKYFGLCLSKLILLRYLNFDFGSEKLLISIFSIFVMY